MAVGWQIVGTWAAPAIRVQASMLVEGAAYLDMRAKSTQRWNTGKAEMPEGRCVWLLAGLDGGKVCRSETVARNRAKRRGLQGCAQRPISTVNASAHRSSALQPPLILSRIVFRTEPHHN
jgi:hypothetical protein